MRASALFPAALMLWCTVIPAHADGTLLVTDAWVRESPPTARVLAGYLTLTNTAHTPLTIEAVSSPDFEHVEIHRSLVEDGIARMQPVTELTLPAGGSISLEPGGYHLMLFNPARPLGAGDSVKLLVQPGDGACIPVSAPVRRQAAVPLHQH